MRSHEKRVNVCPRTQGKYLVSVVLTAVFAYMAVTGNISQDFMTIYAVIIAFYFGTQSQKTQDVIDKGA